MNADQLHELEIKVAFLEDALNKLSEEHFIQQKELEKLKASHALVLETLKNGGLQHGQQPTPEDELPPHY